MQQKPCCSLATEQLLRGKIPRFQDPMRFLFWTFLKMSIFGFLKIIFFCRTEKSGMKICRLLSL
jgi:hypothetical protein